MMGKAEKNPPASVVISNLLKKASKQISGGRSTEIFYLSKSSNTSVEILGQVKVLHSKSYSSKRTKVLTSKCIKVPKVKVLIMQNSSFHNNVYPIVGLQLSMHSCVHHIIANCNFFIHCYYNNIS